MEIEKLPIAVLANYMNRQPHEPELTKGIKGYISVDDTRGDGRGDRAEIAWYQRFLGFWDNLDSVFYVPSDNSFEGTFV